MAVVDAQRRSRIQRFIAGQPLTERIEDIFDFQNAFVLGSGSLGEVVRATDKNTQQSLALKIVSADRLNEVGLSEGKLRREVSVLNDLVHPNIIRLFDVLVGYIKPPCITGNPPYFCIVTESVDDAEPLSQVIRLGGSQPKLAWKIVPQLVSALAMIHLKGIVHRDVWSENVLLDKNGRAVLVDFGTAEYIDKEALGHFLNLPYMSPEAGSGEPQHPADDAWSFGILVMEMVTGIFVTERMGCSDRPFSNELSALATAIDQTFVLGGQDLGWITAGLLNRDLSGRVTMADVLHRLSQLQPNASHAQEAWQTHGGGQQVGRQIGVPISKSPSLNANYATHEKFLCRTASQAPKTFNQHTSALSQGHTSVKTVLPQGSVNPCAWKKNSHGRSRDVAKLAPFKNRLNMFYNELEELTVLFSGCNQEEAEAIMERFKTVDRSIAFGGNADEDVLDE